MPLPNEWAFSYPNRLSDATLVSTDQIGEMVVGNITDTGPDKILRTSSDPTVFEATQTASNTVQCIMLRFPTGTTWFTSGDQCTVSLSDVSVGDTDVAEWVFDLEVDPITGCAAFIADTEVSAQYIEIRLPLADIEYAHIGPLVTLDFDYNEGAETTPTDTTAAEPSLYGGTIVDPGAQYERFIARHEIRSTAVYSSWRTFRRAVGIETAFAFFPSQTDFEECFVARFVTPPTIQKIGHNRWAGGVEMEAFR